jgi:hypothetical protein
MRAIFMAVGLSGAALLGGACGASNSGDSFGDDGGSSGGSSSGAGGSCSQCAAASDCAGGEQCVQLAGDTYCATACNSGGSCDNGASCANVTTFDGQSTQACVPAGECSGGSGGGDAGGGSSSGTSSSGSGSGSGSGSSSGASSSGGGLDAGGTPTGTVGANGGTLSRLLFGVVGDTRPANYDDVSGYPTAIITKIFQDIEAFSPKPPFILATGDYQFSSSGNSSTASQQLDLYLGARKNYSGVQFPTMGNHECTGSTNSNCGAGNTNGITANYTAFMNQLLGPIGQTKPYYAINVNATDGSWTAKFVFVAANAWDSGQASWLTTTMAQKTTYTFIVRHESSETTGGPPGESGSDTIIANYPDTLLIVGHSHTYGHYNTPNPREVIIGNGGAPLTNTSKDYGFGIFSQRSDGAIVGDMVDYSTLKTDSYFHFVVKPDGTLTQ